MLRPNLPELGPLRRAPQRTRPPFDVADSATEQQPGETTDQWRTRIGNDRETALLEALDGIELGAHDRRIVEWLAGWEPSTVATVVSWIYRARAAGQQSVQSEETDR